MMEILNTKEKEERDVDPYDFIKGFNLG